MVGSAKTKQKRKHQKANNMTRSGQNNKTEKDKPVLLLGPQFQFFFWGDWQKDTVKKVPMIM